MFDIEVTIQSQYAASPHIIALVNGYFDLIDPYPDIQLFYNNIFNLEFARGVGLDIWGRIVGIERKIKDVPSENNYLGFYNPANEYAAPFNNAPFFSNDYGGSTYILQDNAYRLLIKTKALANIGTGSLADLNRQLSSLLPNYIVGVRNQGTMLIRIYVLGDLKLYEKNLLSRGDLPPIPAGVGFEILTVPARTFGFAGSGLQPFNQGVFFNLEKGLTHVTD